ncbi:MAG: lipoprotein [Hyphomicrobiaceae bacterium]|nr:lipoprotein [Hyphomicrobiaceae bacterium]
MKRFLLAAIILLLVAGCSKGVRYSPGELSAFTPEVREHIKKKEVAIGMPMAAVRYAWGAPKAVKPIPEENKEIWVYSDARVYVTKLTFVDGKVVESSAGFSLNNPIAPPKDKAANKSEEQK